MIVSLTINDWDEYQTRKDLASMRWFRVDHNFYRNSKIMQLPIEARYMFLVLIAMAAEENKDGKIEVHSDYLKTALSLGNRDCKVLNDYIALLKSLKLIALHEVVTKPYENVPYITEHNITEHNNTKSITTVVDKSTTSWRPPQVFESLINQLPKNNTDIWLELYDNDDGFLKRESLKAWGYYTTNKRKMPKNINGWVRALSSWYERAWVWRAKDIKGIKSHTQTEIERQENIKRDLEAFQERQRRNDTA